MKAGNLVSPEWLMKNIENLQKTGPFCTHISSSREESFQVIHSSSRVCGLMWFSTTWKLFLQRLLMGIMIAFITNINCKTLQYHIHA